MGTSVIKKLIVSSLVFCFSCGYLMAQIKTADQTWTADLEKFENMVIKAKELGDTHVELSRNNSFIPVAIRFTRRSLPSLVRR